MSDLTEPCKLVGFLPFTDNDEAPASLDLAMIHGSEGNSTSVPTNHIYTHLAAAMLAVDHFNTRNAAVVPELAEADYVRDCPVFLPEPDFGNSNNQVSQVAQFLMYKLTEGIRYCAIVGPKENDPAMEATHVASGLKIPMITHGATDNRLSTIVRNPYTARTNVNLHVIGEAIVAHFRSKGRTDHLAVVAITQEIGEQYTEVIDNAAKESGFKHIELLTITPDFRGYEPNSGAGYALGQVKKLGYRNIFVVLKNLSGPLPAIADHAEEFGLNNGDVVWGISGNVDFGGVAELASQNANISKLVRGMSAIRPLDGFEYNPSLGREDPFLREWQAQNATMVDRINNAHPIRQKRSTGYYQAEPDYFQTHLPEHGAGFMYDAVMSIGLAKCREAATTASAGSGNGNGNGNGGVNRRTIESINEDNNNNNNDDYESTSSQKSRLRKRPVKGSGRRTETHNGDVSHTDNHNHNHDSGDVGVITRKLGTQRKRALKANRAIVPEMEAVYETSFHGATGHVIRGDGNTRTPGNRNRDTIVYGAYNFRETLPEDLAINPNMTTWFYLSDINNNGTLSTDWIPVRPFVFANGLTTPPLLNRAVPPQNYLNNGVHTTGLALMAIALCSVLVGTIFLAANNSEPVIRQNQPVFLYLLMMGCALMASSIFMFSFDESFGWSVDALDWTCLSLPWLVSLGYITIYSALFMKLWRVNKVLSFRRATVKVKHVFAPFAVLTLCTVAILLVWSIVDPLSWNRTVIDLNTDESYGRCNSDYAMYFVIPLVCLMALSTISCAVMAWITKDVDSRFADSQGIFNTIFVQMQLLLLGIPTLIVLGYSSADATYLGRSMVVFLLVMTVVILMIGPKVVRTLQSKQRDGSTSRVDPSRGPTGAGSEASQLSNGTGRRRGNIGQVTVSGLNIPPHRQAVLSTTTASSRGLTPGQAVNSNVRIVSSSDNKSDGNGRESKVCFENAMEGVNADADADTDGGVEQQPESAR